MMQGSNNDSDLILQNGLKDLFDKWAYLLCIRLIYVFYSYVLSTGLEYKTFKIDLSSLLSYQFKLTNGCWSTYPV